MRNSLDIFTVLTLHSILVKSIRAVVGVQRCRGRLYIPFWLNLYLSFLSMNSKPKLSLHSILVKSIPVMCRKLSCALTALHSILVKSIRGRMPSPERRCVTLHSILVKSILMIRLTMMSRKKLYIPFWLNLY